MYEATKFKMTTMALRFSPLRQFSQESQCDLKKVWQEKVAAVGYVDGGGVLQAAVTAVVVCRCRRKMTGGMSKRRS